jgi:hypothetical protein
MLEVGFLYLKVLPCTCLENVESDNNFSQDSQHPTHNMNYLYHKCKFRVLLLYPVE